MMRYTALALLLAGCSDTYLRDGVTDGDTFFLAPLAYTTDDPAVASWVRYSLVLSTCQLQIDGDNPARASSFDCERTARHQLVDAWQTHRQTVPPSEDEYLDVLSNVFEAGFLDEYTAHYFYEDGWQLPADLDTAAFALWQEVHLKRHRPQKRLIGYWGYRETLA